MKKSILFGTFVIMPIVLQGCDMPDPETVRANLHLPPPDFVGNEVIGQQLFVANCARCHGANGQGTNQGPPLLDKTYRPGHHPDIAIHMAVKNGAKQHHWAFGDMPPIEGLSPEDVGHMVTYIRIEQKKAGIF